MKDESDDRSTGVASIMKANAGVYYPHDTKRECGGLERGTLRLGRGIFGKKKKSGAVLYACGADDRTVPEWNSGGLPHGVGQRRKPMQGTRRKRVLDSSLLPGRWI